MGTVALGVKSIILSVVLAAAAAGCGTPGDISDTEVSELNARGWLEGYLVRQRAAQPDRLPPWPTPK